MQPAWEARDGRSSGALWAQRAGILSASLLLLLSPIPDSESSPITLPTEELSVTS